MISSGDAKGPWQRPIGDHNGPVDAELPPPKLAYNVYLDAISEYVAALAGILKAAPADVPVPTCPEWSLRDLGAHAGDFAAFYTHRLCDTTGATRPPWPDTWRPKGASPLNGQAPGVYFDDRAQFLLALLRTTSPATEMRTWNIDDQTVHFVARRSTHEFAVHRVDAQIAVGAPQPIDAVVAVDGIEEIFTMLDIFTRNSGTARGERLHLQSNDEFRDWVIQLEADKVKVTRQPAAADLTLTGAASDLELLLYGRPTVSDVEKVGNHVVLDAWYRTFTFT